MKQVTCIIADDEENLRVGITKQLKQLWPQLNLIGQVQNGIEALNFIENQRPDIAFLDIQMPGMTGIEVAGKVSHICKIIFITAHDQYAVQAFENEAVDYILKPVTKKRLQTAILRLQKFFKASQKNDDDKKIQKVIKVLEDRKQPDYLRLVKVKRGNEIHFVPVAQIFYFKAEDKYTIVQTIDHEFLIKTTIKELENCLDPKQFWRVHRSSIVNIEKIRVIKRSFTNQMMAGFNQLEQTIAVSRSYEHLFRQM
jgi:DNA-binding LytR/AlgR family response regulator